MTGKEVKELLRNNHIFQWQLAAALSISESTMVRQLRGKLDKEQQIAVLEAIERLKAQKD